MNIILSFPVIIPYIDKTNDGICTYIHIVHRMYLICTVNNDNIRNCQWIISKIYDF